MTPTLGPGPCFMYYNSGDYQALRETPTTEAAVTAHGWPKRSPGLLWRPHKWRIVMSRRFKQIAANAEVVVVAGVLAAVAIANVVSRIAGA